jgi:putative colanic acid biosynthesis UDP-glucose lipid carrier transferase
MYYSKLTQTIDTPAAPEVRSPSAPIPRISYQNVELIAGLIDMALVVLACILAWQVWQFMPTEQQPPLTTALGTGLVNSLAFGYVARSRGLYRIPVLLAPARYVGRLFVAWALVSLLFTAFLLLLRNDGEVLRGTIMTAMTAAALQITFLVLVRLSTEKVFRSMMASGTMAGRRVVTIGEPQELSRLGKAVLFRYFGLKEVARVPVEDDPARPTEEILIALDRAIQEARDHGAEEFILALRWSSKELLEIVRRRLRASPLPAHLLPDSTIRSVLGRRILSTRGPRLNLEIQRAPLSLTERTVKRMADILISASAIVLLLPLFALVAIAIKLDSRGPVIFKQRRNGFDANQFVIYKFRTMTVLEDGPEIAQACPGDKRVTRIGKLLRSSSIDELPQLLNVLEGDMSIVGPRPHALAHDEEYKSVIAEYAYRHHVKPGITGWAQVNGCRGETRHIELMAERIKLDLFYINHWSLRFDIAIVLRTCFEVLRHRAY